MKKLFKIVIILFFVMAIGALSVLSYVKFGLPDVGKPQADLKIERTPERIARGKYLANSVSVCMDCHSKRDWFQFTGPITPGTLGMGGDAFDQKIGIPGVVYARNITPYSLGSWTDGEILRAMTTGVSKDGSALFPLMPYHSFGKMDKEDAYSIIAYLRTIPSIKNEVPPTKLDFPMNFIVNTIPVPAQFQPMPDPSNTVEYGRYLVSIANCSDCHTKAEKGVPLPGMDFAGGMSFPFPGGVVTSANLTPDSETGIGNWTKEAFVSRFKLYTDPTYHLPKTDSFSFNSPMPWTLFATMEKRDLEAIYDYLRTVKPVTNNVTKFAPTASIASKNNNLNHN